MDWTPVKCFRAINKLRKDFIQSVKTILSWDHLLYEVYSRNVALFPFSTGMTITCCFSHVWLVKGLGCLFEYFAISYCFVSTTQLQEMAHDLRKGTYPREFQHFATVLVSSFRNKSQKCQLPLMALTSLIKQKGVTKSLQDLLSDLGICCSYSTLYRYEKEAIPKYEKDLFRNKMIKGGANWLDNFSRLHIHSSVNNGNISLYLLLNCRNLRVSAIRFFGIHHHSSNR